MSGAHYTLNFMRYYDFCYCTQCLKESLISLSSLNDATTLLNIVFSRFLFSIPLCCSCGLQMSHSCQENLQCLHWLRNTMVWMLLLTSPGWRVRLRHALGHMSLMSGICSAQSCLCAEAGNIKTA